MINLHIIEVKNSFCHPACPVGNVIELRRSGNLLGFLYVPKSINGRLKPFRYSLLAYTVDKKSLIQ